MRTLGLLVLGLEVLVLGLVGVLLAGMRTRCSYTQGRSPSENR